MRHQRIGRHRRPVDQLHIGARQLARMRVRLANSPRKSHRRMAHQRLFDLCRINVVPAPNDQVLGAARDPQIPIAVKAAQITGAQVFIVIIQVLVLFGFGICIAGPDARIAHANLTNLVHSRLNRAVRRALVNLDIRIGERDPDRADFLLSIDGIARHKTGGFGHAVTFDNLDTRRRLIAFEQLLRQWRRAGECGFHRADIGINPALHHGRNRRGNGGDKGDLPPLRQLPDIVEHALAAITLRRGKDAMRARGNRPHQHHLSGHHVE
mmetsp:Transcript_18179/g.28470  ORF Transcript_18179/g.28470 Transcript_18179/m.28470 type:complete len:267 (-) Transcript_18179:5005-5805(-)